MSELCLKVLTLNSFSFPSHTFCLFRNRQSYLWISVTFLHFAIARNVCIINACTILHCQNIPTLRRSYVTTDYEPKQNMLAFTRSVELLETSTVCSSGHSGKWIINTKTELHHIVEDVKQGRGNVYGKNTILMKQLIAIFWKLFCCFVHGSPNYSSRLLQGNVLATCDMKYTKRDWIK